MSEANGSADPPLPNPHGPVATAVAAAVVPLVRAIDGLKKEVTRSLDALTKVVGDNLEVSRSTNTVVGKILAEMQPPVDGDGEEKSPLHKLEDLLSKVLDSVEGVPEETVTLIQAALDSASQKAGEAGAAEGGGA